jgi:hypothetical protein
MCDLLANMLVLKYGRAKMQAGQQPQSVEYVQLVKYVLGPAAGHVATDCTQQYLHHTHTAQLKSPANIVLLS